MLRDVLQRIGTGYLAAKAEPYKEHPLARYIRHDGPEEVHRAVSDPQLNPGGGCGESGWAHGPWIGLFDPAASEGPQHGFYIVYLFSTDMKRVYLSLNQGTTEVITELGNNKKTLAELLSRASIMRERASGFRNRLPATEIRLTPITFYQWAYEAAHVFGCRYRLEALPAENVLVDDLEAAVRLYRALILYGGGSILSDDEAAEAGLDTASIEEKRQYVAHRKIERNRKTSKKVKRVQGCVCQACSCDFGVIYGEAAAGYIEAHHLVPLSGNTRRPVRAARPTKRLCGSLCKLPSNNPQEGRAEDRGRTT